MSAKNRMTRVERMKIFSSVDNERKHARLYTRADGGRGEAKDESNADERAVGATRLGCFRDDSSAS